MNSGVYIVRLRMFIAIMLVVIGLAATASADVMEAWVARYNGTATLWDASYDIALDPSGNVIVTGVTLSGLVFNFDYITAKYDPLGTEVWVKKYSGPEDDDGAEAVAVDSNGNVYVTGHVINSDWDYDIVTVKYNAAGVQQWATLWDGTGDGDDQPSDIAVNDDGEAFVIGTTYTDASTTDSGNIVVLKYNTDGTIGWDVEIVGTDDLQDEGIAIGLDSNGDVYVAGTMDTSASSDDWYIVKLHSNDGSQAWSYQLEGGVNSTDYVWDLAVTNAGATFIAGSVCVGVDAGTCNDTDAAVLNLDAAGDLVYLATFTGNEAGFDDAYTLAINSAGHAVAAGSVANTDQLYDLFAVEFDDEGSVVWSAQYDSADNADDGGVDVAIDGDDNVVVTGYSMGLLTNYDFLTIKYDDAGTQLWATTYDGPMSGDDQAIGVVLDDNEVYVTGPSMGAFYDMTTIRYTECDGCWIAGTCYDDGDSNPSNSCEVCNIDEDTHNWSANDGATCDDGEFCNGDDTCQDGACSEHSGDPCEDNGIFCDGEETCDETSDECVSSGDPCEDNGIFCDGEETCDETNDECDSSGNPCPDDGSWCNGEEFCDEVNSVCITVNVPNCGDDGQFCNGDESCDEENDECAHSGDPCEAPEVCDENEDECTTETDDDADDDTDDDDDSDDDSDDDDDDDDTDDDNGGGDDDDDDSGCGC